MLAGTKQVRIAAGVAFDDVGQVHHIPTAVAACLNNFGGAFFHGKHKRQWRRHGLAFAIEIRARAGQPFNLGTLNIGRRKGRLKRLAAIDQLAQTVCSSARTLCAF